MDDPSGRLHAGWRATLGGGSDPGEVRFAVLGLAGAVEASLRRALREDPELPASLRLRVLDPAQCSFEEVSAILMHAERISPGVQEAIRRLRQLAEHVRSGAEPATGDAATALHLMDRIERELPLLSSSLPTPTRTSEIVPVPVAPVRRRRIRTSGSLAALALVLLLLLGVFWWERVQRKGLERGIVLYEQGALEEADAQLRSYVGWQNDPAPLWYLARIQREAGALDSASVLLRKVTRLDPKDARAHRELGAVLVGLGRFDAAVQRFRTAVELEPESAAGWLGLVRSLRAAGRDRTAARVLERAPAGIRERLLAPETTSTPPLEVHGRT